jgi:hypothetical protein
VIAAAWVLRALVGGALAAAGAGKLLDGAGARIGPVLLGAASGPVALAAACVEDALPCVEILTAIAVLGGVGRVARHVLACGLGAAFCAIALAIPDGVRCGCFGVLGDFDSRAAHVAVAGMLTLAAAALVVVESKLLKTRDLGRVRRIQECEAT